MAPTTPKHGLVLLYLFSLASAQGTPTDLKSCVDVNCPILPNSTVTECKVNNHTLSAVGVSPFNFTIGNESGAPEYSMAWTVGVQEVPLSEIDKAPDHDDTNFVKMERTYFLGSPKEVNLTDNKTLGGCAL